MDKDDIKFEPVSEDVMKVTITDEDGEEHSINVFLWKREFVEEAHRILGYTRGGKPEPVAAAS